MSSNTEIIISHRAFAKIILHILKHLNNDCYGALIGKVSTNDKVEIMDSFALSHDKVLIPQLELFMKMVEKKLVGTDYYVVGFYENLMFNFDKIDNIKPSLCSYFMCEGLSNSKKTPKPYLLEISHLLEGINKDKKRIQDVLDYKVFKYHNGNSGSFEEISEYKENDELFNLVKSLLAKHLEQDIVDFDDHLLNTKNDFTNSILDMIIEQTKN